MDTGSRLATYAKLRHIKVFREQHRAAALAAARTLVEQRAAELESKRRALAEFRAQREAREQALFDEISGRAVQPRDIEAMNSRVALLREREAAMQSALMDAETGLAEARQAMDQARAAHIRAQREVEKLDQLIEVARRTEAREQAAREENEVEEIVTAGFARAHRHQRHH